MFLGQHKVSRFLDVFTATRRGDRRQAGGGVGDLMGLPSFYESNLTRLNYSSVGRTILLKHVLSRYPGYMTLKPLKPKTRQAQNAPKKAPPMRLFEPAHCSGPFFKTRVHSSGYLNYYIKETILCTIDPYYGNLNLTS